MNKKHKSYCVEYNITKGVIIHLTQYTIREEFKNPDITNKELSEIITKIMERIIIKEILIHNN